MVELTRELERAGAVTEGATERHRRHLAAHHTLVHERADRAKRHLSSVRNTARAAMAFKAAGGAGGAQHAGGGASERWAAGALAALPVTAPAGALGAGAGPE